MLKKYPQKSVKDIMKHLFHGSNETDPKKIYESDVGLDRRFSKDSGLYGNGIYFANNSQYSHNYAWKVPEGNGKKFQMFVCLVLKGDSTTRPEKQYKVPPFKLNSQTERYDSINNGQGGHTIIYDNLKSYPGYLVTYTL